VAVSQLRGAEQERARGARERDASPTCIRDRKRDHRSRVREIDAGGEPRTFAASSREHRSCRQMPDSEHARDRVGARRGGSLT
jgi:hypothetical protein